ncbi:hypothetical protein NMY22_g4799 [Coprinellus aureogranulatus]|nr:hypothetical protein NMY22_g4799 [Coprinellus aureogranulatus]
MDHADSCTLSPSHASGSSGSGSQATAGPSWPAASSSSAQGQTLQSPNQTQEEQISVPGVGDQHVQEFLKNSMRSSSKRVKLSSRISEREPFQNQSLSDVYTASTNLTLKDC